jgi:UDP-glucuronate decarboxylase
VRVARIFNTFGPRMHPNDGRVVSNFIIQVGPVPCPSLLRPALPQLEQALQGKDITIYGNGEQTRSFQYVDDLVSGLVALMAHDYTSPVNIGNPDEYTVKVCRAALSRPALPTLLALLTLAGLRLPHQRAHEV